MKSIIFNPNYSLYAKKNTVYCSSRQVAEEFGKRHDNVVRDIRELDCSAEFRLLNFEESSYRNEQNKKQPMYYMTRNGFMFLVMGYRGKKAAAIKEAIITRFNEMEEFIRSLLDSRLMFKDFTEAIENAHDDPKSYHFSNEFDMVNRIVLGMSAKQFRELHGIDKGDSIRPFLTDEQISDIRFLQHADAGFMEAGIPPEQRKAMLMLSHSKRTKRRTIAQLRAAEI